MSWGQVHGNLDDFESFSSKRFLKETLPQLKLKTHARVLELGCGTGPGACFLATLGLRVHGIDIIPEAIDKAREIAAQRELPIEFEIMDVCKIPLQGESFDIIVDSYCTQGIVTDEDRAAMFAGIKARLAQNGYFLLSCSVFEQNRVNPEVQIVDPVTGRVFIGFDDNDLWDGDSEICYNRFYHDPLRPDVGPEDYGGTLCINGTWYIHRRRYRTPENLRLELENHGFKVLEQSGEVSENAICVHQMGSNSSL